MQRPKTPMSPEAVAVRKLRANTQLSQTEFAELFAIPTYNIQKWEQGINKPPKYVIKMMTRILNMNAEIEQLKSQK